MKIKRPANAAASRVESTLVLEDPEQEEAKMPDLDTAEPEEIAGR